MSIKLYPPTVYLFAYSSADSYNKMSSNWLWKKCNNFIHQNLGYKLFTLQNSIKQEEDLRLSLEDLIAEQLYSKELPNYYQIQSEKIIRSYSTYKFYPLYIESSDRITKVHALRIDDTYTLGIKIFPKPKLKNKELTIEQLSKINFNKNNCLLFRQEGNNLFVGQNILIVVRLSRKYQNKSLEWLKDNVADQYIDTLFDKSYNKPIFNKSGQVFGTSTFEYSLYKYPDENHHIYIRLLNNKNEENIEQKTDSKVYYHFIELFLYKSRVIDAFKQIKILSQKAKNKNINIEQQIEDITSNAFNKDESRKLKIEFLNKQLLKFTQNSLKYGSILDYIEDWRNVLVDNAEKYQNKINEINSYYPNKNFDLLYSFSNITCINYENKVEKELNLFEYRLRHLDIMTDEIEHLIKQIKTNDEYAERENDRNQNIAIFAAATGIATAEIANNNINDKYADKPYYDIFLDPDFIQRFVYSILFGCFVAICLWIIWRIWKSCYQRYQHFTTRKNKNL